MSKMNNTNTNTQYKNGSASNKAVATTTNKYFCKVCQDAGKPESIYTSHNVRQTQDKTAPVTCPTLLAQECRYCHKQGHSIKYCPIIKDQNDRKQQYQHKETQAQQPIRKPEPKKNTSKNVYMIFADESDEEREREQERIRNPVPTPQIIKTQVNPSAISYASVLVKEKEKETEIKEVKQYVPVIKKPQAKFNWADCDSDDEEEYYASIKEEDE